MTEETAKTETAPTTENSVVDVLHFDPFKKGDEIPKVETKPSDTATADTGTGDEKTGADVSPSPAPAPVPTKDAGATDQGEYWRQIAEHQKTLIDGGKKEEPAKKDEGMKIPDYNFNVPDKLIEALTSQEVPVFKQGIVALIQGMAAAVHAQMVNHLDTLYNPRFEGIPAQIIQTIQSHTQAKAVEADFYGKYKELDHPQLRNLVLQTANAVAKEKKLNAWNDEIRDETAKRVKDIIAVATGQKVIKPKPPAMMNGSGARPPKKTETEADDIASTLGF